MRSGSERTRIRSRSRGRDRRRGSAARRPRPSSSVRSERIAPGRSGRTPGRTDPRCAARRARGTGARPVSAVMPLARERGRRAARAPGRAPPGPRRASRRARAAASGGQVQLPRPRPLQRASRAAPCGHLHLDDGADALDELRRAPPAPSPARPPRARSTSGASGSGASRYAGARRRARRRAGPRVRDQERAALAEQRRRREVGGLAALPTRRRRPPGPDVAEDLERGLAEQERVLAPQEVDGRADAFDAYAPSLRAESSGPTPVRPASRDEAARREGHRDVPRSSVRSTSAPVARIQSRTSGTG